MVSLDDHNQFKQVVGETLAALCENTLKFESELRIEGMLAVTVDCETVFLVPVSELLPSRGVSNSATTPRPHRPPPACYLPIMPPSTSCGNSVTAHQMVVRTDSAIAAIPNILSTVTQPLSCNDSSRLSTGQPVSRSCGNSGIRVEGAGSCSTTSRVKNLPALGRNVRGHWMPMAVVRNRPPGRCLPRLQQSSPIPVCFSVHSPTPDVGISNSAPIPMGTCKRPAVEAYPILAASQNVQGPFLRPVKQMQAIEIPQGQSATNSFAHPRRRLAIPSQQTASFISRSPGQSGTFSSPQMVCQSSRIRFAGSPSAAVRQCTPKQQVTVADLPQRNVPAGASHNTVGGNKIAKEGLRLRSPLIHQVRITNQESTCVGNESNKPPAELNCQISGVNQPSREIRCGVSSTDVVQISSGSGSSEIGQLQQRAYEQSLPDHAGRNCVVVSQALMCHQVHFFFPSVH